MISSHPLYQRFPHTFDFIWPTTGENLVVEWMRDNGDLFFRPRDADVMIIWHLLDLFGKKTPDVALREALEVGQLRRAVPLSEQEFVFWNQKDGIYAVSGRDAGAAFSLPESARVRGERRLFWDLFGEFSAYLHSTSTAPTDFEKARTILQENSQGHEGWTTIEVENGSLEQLKELTRAMVAIYDPAEESTETYCSISSVPDHRLIWRGDEDVPTLLMKTISQWFKPVLQNRRRVRGFSSWNVGFVGPSYLVVEPCSAHERLEGLLMLRDFLSDKLSREQIEEILRT